GRHLAAIEPARRLEIEHEDLGLQKRGGHLLAFARLLALEERDEDAQRAEETGREVGDGNTDAHRPAARLARDRHEPAHALRDLIDTRSIPIGTVLTEPGDARVDEPRIDLAQRRVV